MRKKQYTWRFRQWGSAAIVAGFAFGYAPWYAALVIVAWHVVGTAQEEYV